jgi:glycosyltransferase involved in cell wall biosynthesis
MTFRSREAPLVSIIVPVFNGEQYLRESLDSILAQTYAPTEVLVMDDGSTDSTPAIISSYGDRVQHHRQPRNLGIYGNSNAGIALARGDYVAIYHADDVYHPSIVEREVAFLQQYPEAGAVFCQDIFIDAQGREVGRLRLPEDVRGGRPLAYPVVFNALLRHKNVFLCCPSSMVRASVYRTVGGYRDAEFLNSSDLEMWLRIARRYPLGVLEEYLLRYRRGHGSSAQRYHRLRTDPERCFRIMDLYLAKGDRAIATREALAAYEAHRAEDQLMRVCSLYILGRADEARALLGQIRPGRIVGSPAIQRDRMLILYLGLHGLLRLPRIPAVAACFRRRWHEKGSNARQPFRLRFALRHANL